MPEVQNGPVRTDARDWKERRQSEVSGKNRSGQESECGTMEKENPMTPSTKCPKMTPQEQAEAMARELWSKPRTFDETATALSKPIAENERLKKGLEDHQRFTGTICLPTDVPISYANLQSQLTATEARLNTASNFIDGIASGWDCDTGANGSHPDYCRKCSALTVLSTLTAEDGLKMRFTDQTGTPSFLPPPEKRKDL